MDWSYDDWQTLGGLDLTHCVFLSWSCSLSQFHYTLLQKLFWITDKLKEKKSIFLYVGGNAQISSHLEEWHKTYVACKAQQYEISASELHNAQALFGPKHQCWGTCWKTMPYPSNYIMWIIWCVTTYSIKYQSNNGTRIKKKQNITFYLSAQFFSIVFICLFWHGLFYRAFLFFLFLYRIHLTHENKTCS